mmetsp:Transcript_45133/g.88305  ORF Transcript_45133/g.88305 Transcript_45133/m.88305 type:complete len:188 (+) Transcript_45133:88-651(+)
MSQRQIVDPSKIGDVHNRHEIYDNMMAGLSTGRYKLANLEVPAQEKKDKELAKLLYYQLNTNTESEKNISRDEEMARSVYRELNQTNDLSHDREFARSLDRDEEMARSVYRELNQTNDLSHDRELARSLDQQLNISAVASAGEDVLDFPPSAEIPDLSRDWEFAKSLDKQLNISIDTSEADVLENKV